ncbi:MAG: DUF3823 domain-containing protein [Chitinophagaceae bacterium]
MKSARILFALTAVVFVFAGCAKDNYTQPSATLTGQVSYQGKAVGVRSNGVQLELWQHGYQVYSKIPVFIAQDGTFSASLFNGDYKLVLLKGNGPWVDKADSIDVHVNGSATIDVPVTPYYTISNETIQKNGTAIAASGKITKVSTNAIERVSLYIGTTTIVDATNNNAVANQTGVALGNLSQPITFNMTLSAALAARDYVYGRIGVKTSGIGEMLYTQPQKIHLK